MRWRLTGRRDDDVLMRAQDDMAALLAADIGSRRVAVEFRGGKATAVLAHMLRDLGDRAELVWVNTSAALPYVAEAIRGSKWDLPLKELSTNQEHYVLRYGLPSLVVPVRNTWAQLTVDRHDGKDMKPGSYGCVVSDWISCCTRLRVAPIEEYAALADAVLISPATRNDGEVFNYQARPLTPLWDWPDGALDEYLDVHQVQVPSGLPSILEMRCWSCTATMDVERITRIAEQYPERFKKLFAYMSEVWGCVNDEVRRNEGALQALLAEDRRLKPQP